MKIIDSSDKKFKKEFKAILNRSSLDMDEVSPIVKKLLKEVKDKGDKALKKHISKFDGWQPQNSNELLISPKLMKKAYKNLDKNLKSALHLAYQRIKSFHEKQMPKSWIDFEKNGSMIGQKVTAVDSVGLYIPGGKAVYPSSLLMNAIPAIVAGVEKIVVTTPAIGNEVNELLLGAMYLCNIKTGIKIGGASAIGALTYGTPTVPKVDVITGPGNIFVATAKKEVYGEVNIDMIAGPSEIGIISDKFAKPKYLAIDLLSQAEHDEMASCIMITTSEKIAKKTAKEIKKYLNILPRSEIAKKSITNRGAIIVVKNLSEAVDLMNQIAPEHLELMVQNPYELLPKIKHAGAIFMGENTPEPMGDYIAGPNHTLPTGGTAKFYSPLSVENFLKKSSIISISKEGMAKLGKACALLAKTEGLTAHEESIKVRLKN